MQELLEIRKRVYQELSATRIVREVLDGRPDLEAYKRYLFNAWNYARYSPVVMSLGASRCVASHPELAKYLLHHADEETGHDAWAIADLQALGVDEATTRASRPVNACASLIGYVHYLAGFGNPIALFGWMYILEAVGKDLGTIAGKELVEGLGNTKAVGFVAGHGVADSAHADELAEQISKYVATNEQGTAATWGRGGRRRRRPLPAYVPRDRAGEPFVALSVEPARSEAGAGAGLRVPLPGLRRRDEARYARGGSRAPLAARFARRLQRELGARS